MHQNNPVFGYHGGYSKAIQKKLDRGDKDKKDKGMCAYLIRLRSIMTHLLSITIRQKE